MQRNTHCPGLLVDQYTKERWWLRRDDDGQLRYHQTPTDLGKLPSNFFNQQGTLKMEFKAA